MRRSTAADPAMKKFVARSPDSCAYEWCYVDGFEAPICSVTYLQQQKQSFKAEPAPIVLCLPLLRADAGRRGSAGRGVVLCVCGGRRRFGSVLRDGASGKALALAATGYKLVEP
eukprot:6176970-Pleurochrysis_carterae.AAC.3